MLFKNLSARSIFFCLVKIVKILYHSNKCTKGKYPIIDNLVPTEQFRAGLSNSAQLLKFILPEQATLCQIGQHCVIGQSAWTGERNKVAVTQKNCARAVCLRTLFSDRKRFCLQLTPWNVQSFRLTPVYWIFILRCLWYCFYANQSKTCQGVIISMYWELIFNFYRASGFKIFHLMF